MCDCVISSFWFFFFKQKTAYEMRISDWSSDVCSSDLVVIAAVIAALMVTFVGRPYVIPSQSMENTLLIGDRIYVQKISYYGSEPGPGDVEIGRASCRERVCQYV